MQNRWAFGGSATEAAPRWPPSVSWACWSIGAPCRRFCSESCRPTRSRFFQSCHAAVPRQHIHGAFLWCDARLFQRKLGLSRCPFRNRRRQRKARTGWIRGQAEPDLCLVRRRAVNPAYRKPEYFLTMTYKSLGLAYLTDGLGAGRAPATSRSFVRSVKDVRPHLHPVEVARDPSPLDRWSIVRLD